MKAFAILTCDAVNIDPGTGKHFIMGHFSSIKVNKLPAVHPTLTVFVALTDIPAGDHTLELKLKAPIDPNAPPPPPPPKPGFWSKPLPPPPPDYGRTLLEQALKSTGADQRLYFIGEVKDLGFDKEGGYKINVCIDKELVSGVGLSVSK